MGERMHERIKDERLNPDLKYWMSRRIFVRGLEKQSSEILVPYVLQATNDWIKKY